MPSVVRLNVVESFFLSYFYNDVLYNHQILSASQQQLNLLKADTNYRTSQGQIFKRKSFNLLNNFKNYLRYNGDDTKQNDTKQNDIMQNDIRQNDTKQNEINQNGTK